MMMVTRAPIFEEQADRRFTDRQKLVLRVGLLEHNGGSLFCLVKNISTAGAQVKPYGRVTSGSMVSLRLGDENPVPGTVAWYRNGLAGLEFEQLLDPRALLRIADKMDARKRRSAPRLNTELNGYLRTGGLRYRVTICDLSMCGARLRTVRPVTFGEVTIIEVRGLPSLRAHVRWSHNAEHGVSFQTPLPMQIVADLSQTEQILRDC